MPIAPPIPDQKTVQGRENQLRFIVNVASRHWLKIAIFTIIGMLLLGILGKLRPEQRYPFASIGEVHIEQSRLTRTKGIGTVQIQSFAAKDLIARTNEKDLAEAVARAIVQHDISTSGPWSDVSTYEELQAKTAEINAAIQLIEASDERIERIQIKASAIDKEKAQIFADYATRVFVSQNREAQLEDPQILIDS